VRNRTFLTVAALVAFAGVPVLGTCATTLSASSPASSSQALSLSCSAASAPSDSGTPDYFLVLKAQYQNHGGRTIAPIIIRFDLHDKTGKVIASHTVIDSNGLAPQYGNSGQWQSVGYPAGAVSLTCSQVTSV
jgi:hypothetical protein